MDFNFFKNKSKDEKEKEKPSPNRQRKNTTDQPDKAFHNQFNLLKKNLNELGMQFSDQELTMSIKSCPGDNDRAIEMLLNGELPPTDD